LLLCRVVASGIRERETGCGIGGFCSCAFCSFRSPRLVSIFYCLFVCWLKLLRCMIKVALRRWFRFSRDLSIPEKDFKVKRSLHSVCLRAHELHILGCDENILRSPREQFHASNRTASARAEIHHSIFNPANEHHRSALFLIFNCLVSSSSPRSWLWKSFSCSFLFYFCIFVACRIFYSPLLYARARE
jgi:hypothetical protein